MSIESFQNGEQKKLRFYSYKQLARNRRDGWIHYLDATTPGPKFTQFIFPYRTRFIIDHSAIKSEQVVEFLNKADSLDVMICSTVSDPNTPCSIVTTTDTENPQRYQATLGHLVAAIGRPEDKILQFVNNIQVGNLDKSNGLNYTWGRNGALQEYANFFRLTVNATRAYTNLRQQYLPSLNSSYSS